MVSLAELICNSLNCVHDPWCLGADCCYDLSNLIQCMMHTHTPLIGRGSRTPQGTYSSRRTLQMSHTTPTKLILVNKVCKLLLFIDFAEYFTFLHLFSPYLFHLRTQPPSTPPPSSTEPIYPPLASCLSPVEQILPALTPSNRL